MDFIVEDKPDIKPKKQNSLWVEKYRPNTLDNYIGNDSIKNSVAEMIAKKDIPHILLFGPPGTGKTTLAKLLVYTIPCDYLYINASSENGIDTVRDKLKSFASGAGFKPLKVVILDEADYLSQNAQAGLRNMLETYSMHTRFILTCNYPEKILSSLNSRSQTFEVKPISKKEVALNLVNILQAENVTFTQEDIVFCVNTYYPDIRKVINFAQQSNINGVLKITKENAIDVDFVSKLIELLKNPTSSTVFNDIRQLSVDIDPNTIDSIYTHLFQKVDSFANNGKEILVILELSDAIKDLDRVIIKARDVLFVTAMYKILQHLKK